MCLGKWMNDWAESAQLFGRADGITSILTIEKLQIRKCCQFSKGTEDSRLECRSMCSHYNLQYCFEGPLPPSPLNVLLHDWKVPSNQIQYSLKTSCFREMLLVEGGVSFPSLHLATLNARSVKWSHQRIGVWREQFKDAGTAECLSPTWVMDRVAGVSSSSIHIWRCAPNGTIPGAPSWHDPWSLVPFIPSHFPIPDFQHLISS